MSTISYLPSRTGADHTKTGTGTAEAIRPWHLHIGLVQLFIVGPGPDAWLACSESCYSGQVGTDRERAIARRAIQILATRHRDDNTLGPAEIRTVLAEAAHEHRHGIPILTATPTPEPEPVPSPPVSSDFDYDHGIMNHTFKTVVKVCRVPPTSIIQPERSRSVSHARVLLVHTITQVCPGIPHKTIAELLERRTHQVGMFLARHRDLIASDASYRKRAARVAAALEPALTA